MTITIDREISPSKVQCKDPNELVKQLGVLANPAGDFSEELERRQKYSANMASKCLSPVQEYLVACLPVSSCCDNIFQR
eukprot:11753886-Ditylum_brightwellii.AAC.1